MVATKDSVRETHAQVASRNPSVEFSTEKCFSSKCCFSKLVKGRPNSGLAILLYATVEGDHRQGDL